jgi:hypothetical protein
MGFYLTCASPQDGGGGRGVCQRGSRSRTGCEITRSGQLSALGGAGMAAFEPGAPHTIPLDPTARRSRWRSQNAPREPAVFFFEQSAVFVHAVGLSCSAESAAIQ